MTHAEPTEAVWHAAAAVERARRALTCSHATALEKSLAALAEARLGLESLAQRSPARSPLSAEADRRALLEIRASLRRLHARLELADGFYGGWLRLRDTLAGGYTQSGSPAASGTGQRVLAEG